MTFRSGLILTAVALLITGASVVFFSSPGQAPNASTFSFDDWLVRCNGGNDKAACALSQQVLDRRSGRSVLQLSFATAPNGTYLLGVVVPLGVSVPDGVTLQVGDATRKFDYSQCLPGGCIASLAANADLIAKIRATPDARLAVIDRLGRPVVMPVSLRGFGAAFDKMNAPPRGSWPSLSLGK